MLRALDLGAGERSLERKPEPLRSPATAPPLRDERNSAERERSSERRERDTGTYSCSTLHSISP